MATAIIGYDGEGNKYDIFLSDQWIGLKYTPLEPMQ
jgi:hypothetical protein